MTTLETVGRRVYFINLPFVSKNRAKSLGATWCPDRKQWWIGTAKKADAEKLVSELNNPTQSTTTEDLDNSRIYAKVKYKDRTYYVIAETRTQATATEVSAPLRCRLVMLDGKTPFWANCSDCELIKKYEGRPERGAYGKPTGRTVYTTLGSIRSFIEDQKSKEEQGIPQCASCHKRSSGLIEDLEDGLMKCRHCCDIPSE